MITLRGVIFMDLKFKVIQRIRSHMHWNERRAQRWYVTLNPMLGGASPDALVKKGEGEKVMMFIDSAEDAEGLPAAFRSKK